jgi:6-phosphogluconolactonase
VDPAKGTLTMTETVPSLGKTPRNITIDPTNQYLISANQAGDNLVVFRIDHKTGHLTPTGSPQTVSQSGGVAFVKVITRRLPREDRRTLDAAPRL